jgi:hypothetical protein
MEKTATLKSREIFDTGTTTIGTKIVTRISGGKRLTPKLFSATARNRDAVTLRTVPFCAHLEPVNNGIKKLWHNVLKEMCSIVLLRPANLMIK